MWKIIAEADRPQMTV